MKLISTTPERGLANRRQALQATLGFAGGWLLPTGLQVGRAKEAGRPLVVDVVEEEEVRIKR